MDRCTQVAKKSLFYTWPFGLACWLWGTIFIDRVNAEEAQQKINSTEHAIKNNNVSIIPTSLTHIQASKNYFKKK